MDGRITVEPLENSRFPACGAIVRLSAGREEG